MLLYRCRAKRVSRVSESLRTSRSSRSSSIKGSPKTSCSFRATAGHVRAAPHLSGDPAVVVLGLLWRHTLSMAQLCTFACSSSFQKQFSKHHAAHRIKPNKHTLVANAKLSHHTPRPQCYEGRPKVHCVPMSAPPSYSAAAGNVHVGDFESQKGRSPL